MSNRSVPLREKARALASRYHSQVNPLKFRGIPYPQVLSLAASLVEANLELVHPKHRETVVAAVWSQDLLNYTSCGYEELQSELGVLVARLAATTAFKGGAEGEYFAGLRRYPYAGLIVVCLLVAKAAIARQQGGVFLTAEELALIRQQLYTPVFKAFFTNLEGLHK